MEKIAALYLAHLNPITKSHENIISQLSKKYHVYSFPVIFLKKGIEVNTRTFPFTYESRKSMLESIFNKNENVEILPDYVFFSPYIKYLPPLVSPYSWNIRKQILKNVKETKFFSYTGDKAEWIALRLYNLHPIKAERLAISASQVKELLYSDALSGESDRDSTQSWRRLVPCAVIRLIEENWSLVEKFARSTDKTIKIMGMKFPTDGILHI